MLAFLITSTNILVAHPVAGCSVTLLSRIYAGPYAGPSDRFVLAIYATADGVTAIVFVLTSKAKALSCQLTPSGDISNTAVPDAGPTPTCDWKPNDKPTLS